MAQRRKDLGFNLSDAEAAMSAFVARIIADDDTANRARGRLYSAGLTPGLIYSFKKGRQREFSAAKLIAALAACEDLEVVIEGRATEGSAAPRWVVHARRESVPSRPQSVDSIDPTRKQKLVGDCDSTEVLAPDRPIQLSLFSSFQSGESVEIEMCETRVTRRETNRAEILVDFLLRPRKAG